MVAFPRKVHPFCGFVYLETRHLQMFPGLPSIILLREGFWTSKIHNGQDLFTSSLGDQYTLWGRRSDIWGDDLEFPDWQWWIGAPSGLSNYSVLQVIHGVFNHQHFFWGDATSNTTGIPNPSGRSGCGRHGTRWGSRVSSRIKWADIRYIDTLQWRNIDGGTRKDIIKVKF